MKKSHYITISITILLGIALLFWANKQESTVFPREELTNLLEQGAKEIELTELTNFSWTKAAVFGPYTQSEWIEDAMGVEFGLFSGSGEVLENQFLLVIANENEILAKISLSRTFGDYAIEDNRYLIVQ